MWLSIIKYNKRPLNERKTTQHLSTCDLKEFSLAELFLVVFVVVGSQNDFIYRKVVEILLY